MWQGVVSGVELHQIRYFVELTRTLHFTRAAEVCNVTQPALTRAIQKLEEELGGPLFHRERSRTQLTELGRLMLPPLQRALAAAHDAKMQADAFRRRETSPLRIGLENSIPPTELTPVLASLRQRNADIELTLREGPRADLCDRMLDGDLDFALLVEADELHERLHRWQLFAERYVLICPPGHRFADLDVVSVADLAAECLLLHDDAASASRKFITDVFARNDVKPRRQHFANSLPQILEMVHASLGVSIAGERLAGAATLLRRPIDVTPDTRTIMLAAVAGRQMGPTPAMFMKLMRARAWSGTAVQQSEAA